MTHARSRTSKGELATITGLGMVSSVGWDVVTSCASLRAGLTRPDELQFSGELDDETAEPIPFIGHPVRGFTDGFYLLGRWTRLAERCMADLMQYGNLPGRSDTGFWKNTELTLVTPLIHPERYQIPQELSSEQIKELHGELLLDSAPLPIPIERLNVLSVGHAGTAIAVENAVQRIQTGLAERVIVLAVDSYLDWFSIEWLSDTDRIKTATNAAGLSPGEAGACVMLESPASSRKRNAPIEAFVLGVATAEKDGGAQNNDIAGLQLTRVLSKILSDVDSVEPFRGDLISDMNGENWRSSAVAAALVRLGDRFAPTVGMILPSTCIGEVGAASGAVALCMAVRSLIRGYSTTRRVMIASISDNGSAGAVCISAHDS